MRHSISNGIFELTADDFGAELAGVKSVKDGYEYIWQKCDIWQGQSPVLFPVVGRLNNDELKFEGRTYTLAKHGFARRSTFAFDGDRDGLSFTLTESDTTLKSYPFRFSLNVCFRLTQTGYTVTHTVKNTGDVDMYFSLGAHPAFNIDMGDKVVMDETETADAYRLGADNLIMAQKTPVFAGTRELIVTPETFRDGALIFEKLNSRGCTVRKADGRNVYVDFGGAPCLGIWAKPGAPYVCVEPWYGLDDKAGCDWSFENKPYVRKLAAGGEFAFTVSVTFD